MKHSTKNRTAFLGDNLDFLCGTNSGWIEYKLEMREYKTPEPYIHDKFDGDHEWVLANKIIKAVKNYRSRQ